MTILGVILVFLGAAISGLIFTGNAPASILALPVPFWAWIALSVAGLVLIMLNRRPGN